MPKYPNIKVKLVGYNGNAFAILGRCLAVMRENGLSKIEQDEFKHLKIIPILYLLV